uniref:Uncharacterized protein n=1 Tax=Vespula pensylvanica TaxID=30213 RepID=A0A834KN62_VESPE|nr:hypothetical protein H0235_013616 [Vespula pensylvanica]
MNKPFIGGLEFDRALTSRELRSARLLLSFGPEPNEVLSSFRGEEMPGKSSITLGHTVVAFTDRCYYGSVLRLLA